MLLQLFIGVHVDEDWLGPPHHSPNGVATVPSGCRRPAGISANAFTVFFAEVDATFLAVRHGGKE